MKFMFHLAFSCLVCIFLAGCQTGSYRDNQELLSFIVKTKQYKVGEYLVNKKNFLPDKESILLKKIEQGSLSFLNNSYCKAIRNFDDASRINNEQYTKSAKNAIIKNVGVNDGIYYSSTYEKSLLKFYQSLANFNIYNRGYCEAYLLNKNKIAKRELSEKEKRLKFSSSRAYVLEWDSFLKGRNINKNDRLYTESLLQKLWGAFIHERQGSSADLQIAKQLYKDAIEVAKNRYAVYPSFNKNYKNFVKNLDNVNERKKYLDPENKYVKDIEKFANTQLNRISNHKNTNLQIIIEDGTVSAKDVEKVKFPIGVITGVIAGSSSLMAILGINSAVMELPIVKLKEIKNEFTYVVKNKNGKSIVNNKCILAEPITDLVYMDLDEKLPSIRATIIAKMTAKYSLAIATTYMAYNSGSRNNGNLLLATLTFKSFEKAIEESSRADIRQWVSLPANIYLTSEYLPDGDYVIEIYKQRIGNKDKTIVYEKEFNINKENNNLEFINIRV